MGAAVTGAVAAIAVSVMLYLTALKVIGFLKWRHIYSADLKHVDALSAMGDRVNELQTRVGRLEMRKGL